MGNGAVHYEYGGSYKDLQYVIGMVCLRAALNQCPDTQVTTVVLERNPEYVPWYRRVFGKK